MKLAILLDTKSNHLTLIRLLLSILVIYSHSFPLGNFGNELMLGFGNDKYGNLAVNCFFVVSGLLITRSYVRSKNIKQYFVNRVLRIFPGFWMALFVTAFLICPLVYWLKNGQLITYWTLSGNSPFGYLWHNLLLKMTQTEIGTMFDSNNYPLMVNGAIWTLSYEFICYLFVALVGYFGLLRSHLAWLFLLLVLCLLNVMVYSGACSTIPFAQSISALIHFMTYFVAGMVMFLFSERISISLRNVLLASVGFLFFSLVSNPIVYLAYHFLMPFVLAYTVMGWAFISEETRWEKKMPDVSYGLYIYGWVVQQSLVYLGVLSDGLCVYFLTAICMTFLLAVSSYYLVEKPCMNLKKAF